MSASSLSTPIPPPKDWKAAYTSEYEKWVAGLSPAQKRKLKERGVDKPDASDDHEAPAPEGDADAGDPAEWNCASTTPDIAANVDTLSDVLQETFRLNLNQGDSVAQWMVGIIEAEAERRKAHTLQRVVGFFMRPGNVKLRAYALAFACELDALNGLKNQTFAAKLLCVSKATMSVCVNQWSDLLDLPRTKHMKSQEARMRYSEDKSKSHWRHPNFTPKPCTA